MLINTKNIHDKYCKEKTASNILFSLFFFFIRLFILTLRNYLQGIHCNFFVTHSNCTSKKEQYFNFESFVFLTQAFINSAQLINWNQKKNDEKIVCLRKSKKAKIVAIRIIIRRKFIEPIFQDLFMYFYL